MTNNKDTLKPTYAMASLIILAFAGAMVWVTSSPARIPSPHGQAGASSTLHGAATDPAAQRVKTKGRQKRVRRVRAAVSVSGGAQGRMDFAHKTQKRLSRHGYKVRLAAVGGNGAIFELSWGANISGSDSEHMGKLKGAQSLHDELRGRGFRRIRMRVGAKVVWSKSL